MEKRLNYDPVILWVTAAVTLGFVGWSAVDLESMQAVTSKVFELITVQFGWLFLLVSTAVLCSCFVISSGRMGNVRLGLAGEKPEFSDFSWFAMIFAGAIAAGIIFWGPVEAMYHMMTPPPYFGEGASKALKQQNAMTYAFFHWGLTPWAFFTIPTIAIAHASFKKGLPLKFSTAFYYIIGDRVHGAWGKAIDCLAAFATIGAISTSTGMIALVLLSGLKDRFGLALPSWFSFVIIGILALVIGVAVYTGLEKGIRAIATLRMWMFIGFWLLVLAFGPTLFLSKLSLQATGQYLFHLIPMSLFAGAGLEGNWVGNWTVFYWAWWMAGAPFTCLYIARISKGRSVRQLVVAVLVLPTLVDFLWFGVIGGAGVFYDISEVVKAQGIESAIFAIASHMPLTGILNVFLLVMVATFSITIVNSSSVALASFIVSPDSEPTPNLRVFSSFSICSVGAILTYIGTLKPMQSVAVATGFPMVFLLVAATAGAFIGVRSEFSEESLDGGVTGEETLRKAS